MSSRGFCRGSVCRGNRAIQSNTPSVSRQKQAADTSDVTTSRIAQIRRTLIWLPGRLTEGAFKGKVKRKVKQLFIFYTLKAKPLFTSFPTQRKSAFRSANNEMTGGLASGGALKCGDRKATFPPLGGDIFKLSILPLHADASAAALTNPQL